MAEIKALISGYARKISGGWIASSSVVLIKSGGKNIVVDSGCNRKKLLIALAREGLKTEDIDFVILTHSHTDHTLLCGIFESAKVLNSEENYDGDLQVAHNGKIPGTDLQIIKTPGHSQEHCSVVVPTEKGIYAVAGDVFWWMDGEAQKIDVRKADSGHPEGLDMKKLVESRKKLLELADYIIPGHGKMFEVP